MLVIVFFIGVFTWMLYGMICMASCGMLPSECTATKIEVQVKVCQGRLESDQFRNYPYSGYITWCFPVQSPSQTRDDNTLCVTELTSCADDRNVAYDRMNNSYPLGTQRDCWYGFSTFSEDSHPVYFQWVKPFNLPPWFLVNAYYSIIACSIIAIVLVFLLVRSYVLKRIDGLPDAVFTDRSDVEAQPLLDTDL
jgi:hypothetical protein